MPFSDPQDRKAYHQAYYQSAKLSNPNKLRCKDQRKRYGITLAEKHQMLADQGYRCAKCGTSNPGGRDWCTDHDHNTKIVRGILCTKCNTGIGKLGDSLAGLMEAVHYLSKSEPTLFPGIWKRTDPKISNSISEPFDPEMQNGCSNSRSSKEMVPVFTVVPSTTSLSITSSQSAEAASMTPPTL